MATGAYDAQDIWQYGEDDPASPFSDTLNLLAESTSDGFASDRGRLQALEGMGGGAGYTPVLTAATTNPTLGTGSVQLGWYTRLGKLVTGGGIVRFGTSGVNAGSSTYLISLPVQPDGSVMVAGGALGAVSTIGSAIYRRQASSAAAMVGAVMLNSAAGTGRIALAVDGGAVTHNVPFAWAAQDAISFDFRYVGV